MGVVSGLVMAYQFGTNWSFFSDFAGSITGPLLAYEVLTAFFLEAGFLGVMRPGRAHGLAGGDLQSVLPLSPGAHGHRRLPGHGADGGRVRRLALLRGDRSPAVKKMFAMAMGMLLLVAPLQAVVGDVHGLNTLKHQPAKVTWASPPSWPRQADGGRVRRLALAARRPQPGGEEDVRDMGMLLLVAPPGGGRRPRTEHAQAPARQGRRHGRPLKTSRAPACRDPVWPARHGQGGNPLRAQHPAPGQPDPHPQLGRAVPRPEVPADRPNVPGPSASWSGWVC